MSLATRCIHCGTVFRVVEDQLKVSEGWVRCGRCTEVFNALEGLFDLDREPPPEWSPPVRPENDPAAAAAGEAEPDTPRDPELVNRLDAELLAPRVPAGGVFPPLEPDPEPLPLLPARAAQPSAEGGGAAPEPAAEPEFVRRAKQHDHWRRSPRRAALATTATVLLLLLGLQVTVHQRDLLAARMPALAPVLAALCSGLGCRLAPPRRLEALAVESSALARTPTPDVFRLSVTLRNRETMAVQLPSIDLALTDGSGALIARRVLSPADFRVAAPVIAAGAEQTLSLPLAAARVSGYTVEIFYP